MAGGRYALLGWLPTCSNGGGLAVAPLLAALGAGRTLQPLHSHCPGSLQFTNPVILGQLFKAASFGPGFAAAASCPALADATCWFLPQARACRRPALSHNQCAYAALPASTPSPLQPSPAPLPTDRPARCRPGRRRCARTRSRSSSQVRPRQLLLQGTHACGEARISLFNEHILKGCEPKAGLLTWRLLACLLSARHCSCLFCHLAA